MNKYKTSKATKMMGSLTPFANKTIKGFWSNQTYLVSSQDGASNYLAYDKKRDQWFINESHFPLEMWMRLYAFAEIISEKDFNQLINQSV